MSASLWLGWPAQHTGPEDPEPPTCCHPTETIAVTQRAHCSGTAASSPDLVASHWDLVPRPPPFPGKIPAGLVVAQAKEERPHPQDDYNLDYRTDLHVLVPSSSQCTWAGRAEVVLFFFSPVCPFSQMGVGWNCCICLELDGQTSALLWGWGEHQQPNRHCFWSCFYFQKPMNLMVEPVPSEEG